MMHVRWIIFALVLLVLALVAMFPLRIAMDMALDRGALLSARQVGGTVWAGRVGDAMLGDERLGTFDVSLAPLPLFIGRTEVEVERLDDPDGPLTGRFFLAGPSEGVASLTGRVAIAGLVAPLPIEALMFDNVDALFDDGICKQATGTITAVPAAAVRFFAAEASGPVSCAEDGRVVATLQGPRGGEEVRLYLGGDGEVEAALSIAGAPPLLAELLQSVGFARDGQGWVLTSRGRLN